MQTDYPLLASQLTALLTDPIPPVSALANTSALIWHALNHINWAGFYLAKGATLYLGPFQGKPACQIIDFGRGVCGAAAASGQIQRVADVHTFPGHIACDAASRSEIVLPLIWQKSLLGVLDIDSPLLDRFSADDEAGLCQLISILLHHVDWSHGLL